MYLDRETTFLTLPLPPTLYDTSTVLWELGVIPAAHGARPERCIANIFFLGNFLTAGSIVFKVGL